MSTLSSLHAIYHKHTENFTDVVAEGGEAEYQLVLNTEFKVYVSYACAYGDMVFSCARDSKAKIKK